MFVSLDVFRQLYAVDKLNSRK